MKAGAPQYTQNVQLKVYDTDVLRFIYPEWDTLDKNQKLQLVQNTGIEAAKKIKEHNVTCIDLFNYLAKNVNPDRNADAAGEKIAFGTDDSSFSSSDQSLNNNVGEITLSGADTDASTHETTFTAFMDSTELNGYTLKELGLIGSDGGLWNHAAISPTVDKTNSETVVAEVFITFSN